MALKSRDRVHAGDVLRQWPFMLVTFLVVGGALFWYVSSMPVRYASNSVVAFQPQPGRVDGRDLISLLIQTYPEFVASGSAVNLAAAAAGVAPTDLASGLDAEIPPLTLNMTIQTELADPVAAQIANQSLVDQVVAKAKVDPYLVATAVSDADLSDTPSGVSAKLLYVVSLVLASGFALIVGIVVARFRSNAKDEQLPA
ncbi:MAG: hypothetical protein V9E82_12100 [Candidatus Nanopelagicales bacterium]